MAQQRAPAHDLRSRGRAPGSEVPERTLLVPTPCNPAVIRDCGPYRKALNLLFPNQTAIQRALRRNGVAGYEPSTLATMLALVQRAPRDSVFWDVGSHVGWYSTLLTTVYAGRGLTALAFEPTPATAALAREIARTNNAAVTVSEVAVSDQPGTATLYLSDRAETSNSLDGTFREHASEIEVPVTTLDLAAVGRELPYLVKIDVENREAQALAGARAMIDQARPWVVCEVLNERSDEALIPELAHLVGVGYQVLGVMGRPPFRVWDGRGELPKGTGSRDWLLAPGPLPRTFRADVRAWLTAIEACGRERNVIVKSGKALPKRWDAPHTEQSCPDRTVRGRVRRLRVRLGS